MLQLLAEPCAPLIDHTQEGLIFALDEVEKRSDLNLILLKQEGKSQLLRLLRKFLQELSMLSIGDGGAELLEDLLVGFTFLDEPSLPSDEILSRQSLLVLLE